MSARTKNTQQKYAFFNYCIYNFICCIFYILCATFFRRRNGRRRVVDSFVHMECVAVALFYADIENSLPIYRYGIAVRVYCIARAVIHAARECPERRKLIDTHKPVFEMIYTFAISPSNTNHPGRYTIERARNSPIYESYFDCSLLLIEFKFSYMRQLMNF